MAKENIGEVECKYCESQASVRKNQKGRLYYFCPKCGIVQPAGASFQDWLLGAAKLYGPGGEPEKKAAPIREEVEPAPAAIPIRETTPKEAEISIREKPQPEPAKKKSLLDYL